MATIRVEPKLHQTLRALSVAEGRPIGQVIQATIDRYEEERFWKAMHEGLAQLRADPVAWRDYQDGVALWETASGDGLEDEEPYFTVEEACGMGSLPRPRIGGVWSVAFDPVRGHEQGWYQAVPRSWPTKRQARRSEMPWRTASAPPRFIESGPVTCSPLLPRRWRLPSLTQTVQR